ncbi:DUF2161 family putative PD-(D/E)XK-type phosphodiesterase [Mycoplasmatota bacterium WC44]
MSKLLEKDLYQPIKSLFEDLDYVVKAEVNSADVTAIKDDQVVIIEMKKSISFKLLYQAITRQKLTDDVFIAIPKPNYKTIRSKSFKEKEHILRRLHLGLILVDKKAEIRIFPKPFDMKISRGKNKKKKNLLIEEFNKRQTSFNVGGVTKTKIITAYREQVIKIAYYLKDSPKTVKELKELTANAKTGNILIKNHYGWFDRVDRGIYELNQLGKNELLNYQHIIDLIKEH